MAEKASILDKYDADTAKAEDAVKDEAPKAVAEPVKEPEAPVAEPEKEEAPKAEPVKEPEAPDASEPEAPIEEAKKDADESSDAAPSPKPFENGGKVEDANDDANGSKADSLSKLEDVFKGHFGSLEKSLGENQASMQSMSETLAGVVSQLADIASLIKSSTADASKSAPVEDVAKSEDPKAKAKKDDDCDDEDCDDKDEKDTDKKDKKSDGKKDEESEKSLDNDAPAEPVEDEPVYVAEKSAAIGSPVAEAVEELKEDVPVAEVTEKSLGDQYVAATENLGKFNNKLINEANHGIISREEYAEKSQLSSDIAYGIDITKDKLDKFNGYIK